MPVLHHGPASQAPSCPAELPPEHTLTALPKTPAAARSFPRHPDAHGAQVATELKKMEIAFAQARMC